MADTSEPVGFGIVGGGWRAGAYLRVAEALPSRFAVAGVVVRDPAKGRAIEGRFHVPTFRTVEAMVREAGQAFAVAAVRVGATPSVLRELAEASLPVLSETPPAWGLDDLDAVCQLVDQGARIQVAEQVRHRPMHAARLAIIRDGIIGEVSLVQASVAHGYHGISLVRALLGLDHVPVAIEARSFSSPLATVARADGIPGEPTSEGDVQSRQVLGLLWFGSKLGMYDFAVDQYYSGFRATRVLVRGARGEINDQDVRWIEGGTIHQARLERIDTGHGDDLRGFHLEGVRLGGATVYRNPYAPARLSDDEIAVATCLDRMVDYVRSGIESCAVHEAANDRHLEMMLEQAVAKGERVEVEPRYGR